MRLIKHHPPRSIFAVSRRWISAAFTFGNPQAFETAVWVK